jgi:hypothetical protein
MIKLKKIPLVEGVLPPTCYKCAKNRASYYLMRETNDRPVDIPLCNVCLSAFLNFLDDRLIKWAYDFAHKEDSNDEK